MLAKSNDGVQKVLVVIWIEKKPTPNKLELVFSKDNAVFNVPIPEDILQENLETSARSVVFRTEEDIGPTTDLMRRLNQAEGQEDVFVRLVAPNGTRSAQEKIKDMPWK